MSAHTQSMKTQPLKNPKYEAYVQERLSGKTQRQAMLAAYPTRKKWKPETVDREASKLEKRPEVNARLEDLKERASKRVTITRAQVLNGMSDTFMRARSSIAADGVSQTAVTAISSIGRTLLDAIPENTADDKLPFVADFALLLAPPFLALHRAVAADVGGEWWLRGGRFSLKSSTVSLEIAAGLMEHEDRSAFVMPKIGKDIGEGVFEQMLWALDKLGVRDEWTASKSPYKLARHATGQVITFRGGDRTQKTKAIKAPNGTYYAYQWFSEVDQFDGWGELRVVMQSVTRDAPEGSVYFRFFDHNPPRSRDAWVNRHIKAIKADYKERVIESSYLDVPHEWIPEQVRRDAEDLKELDEEAYRHEWLGEEVGYGSEVFTRVEVREITHQERRELEYRCYGVDWGFSQDPFAWVKIAYDTKTRTLYILDEFVKCGLSNQESAEVVSQRMHSTLEDDDGVYEDAEPYAVVWCDSAEPKSIADFKANGIDARPALKTGAHNIRNSIKWLQFRKKIVIDTKCAVAVREFANYSYVMTKDGQLTGQLPDADNHTIDAVRYACITLINDRSLT